MTAAVIALAVALGAAMGIIVWLVRRGDRFVDDLMVAKDRSVKQTVAAERAVFEAEKMAKAYESERARARALVAYISRTNGERDDTSDLADDDVDGRVLRIAREWGAANDTRDPVRTATVDPVRAAETPSPTHPDLLRPDGL